MEKLPDSVLLEILSRLDDSADVARCRVASKPFNSVFPGVRKISLRSSPKWYSRVSNCEEIQSLEEVFLYLISKLETVESVNVVLMSPILCKGDYDDGDLTDDDVLKEWLPRVSASLKSLEICDTVKGPYQESNILLQASKCCYNLVKLRLDCVWLSLDNLIPMPMLKKLTLGSILFRNGYLNELSKCFPNLQVLKLFGVGGAEQLIIHHPNLKTFVWDNWEDADIVPSLTLIAPNLTTLEVDSCKLALIHVEAPMLSDFQLRLNGREHACVLSGKMFENLKTLWLSSSFIGSLLSQFPIIETLEKLTLQSEDDFPDSEDSEDLTSDSENDAPRDATESEENLILDAENDAPRDATNSEENLIAGSENDAPGDATDAEENLILDSENDAPRDATNSEENLISGSENDEPRDTTDAEENLILDSENDAPKEATDSELTLGKVFTIFPNVRSVRINSKAWSELESGWNTQGWQILDGREGLKTICAYLRDVDPLSVSFLSSVLDEFVSLSEVSLLIHDDVVATVAERFMFRCMASWPGLKWKWGIWGEFKKDRWITDDDIYNKPHKSSKKCRL